nr:EOG090X03TX [Sida crystallina]
MADEEDNNSWAVVLDASLQESCSLQELRLLCRGQTIPDSLRVAVWHRLLSLPTSCTSNGLESFNEIFDLSNQSALRDDCGQLVGELDNDEEDKVSILSDLESLLTHYCKSHRKVYETKNGWLHILKILVSMKLSKNEMYLYFTALLESYIPSHDHIRGNAMNLFRLLLLYHEPELCSFLDSHKIAPDLYIWQWFSSLFSVSCNIPAILVLWDYYFVHGDPFLIFFLSLVLVVNAKDDIMSLKGEKEKILEFIAALPQQMEAGDIHDFCSLAVLYSAQTPVSYKRDYHQALFGEETEAVESHHVSSRLLSQALCLPVSVQELLVSCKLLTFASKEDSETRALRFFLVDCRPAEQYNAGHLPTAFHLDSNLMLTEPQAFSVAVQALLSAQKQSIAAQSAAGGEHLVFFGSGREAEDQYVHMVVAFFLQRHVQFVGLVQGGFQAVHYALTWITTLLFAFQSGNSYKSIFCAALSSSKSKSATKLYRNLAPIFSIDDNQEDDVNSFRCHEVKESGHAYPRNPESFRIRAHQRQSRRNDHHGHGQVGPVWLSSSCSAAHRCPLVKSLVFVIHRQAFLFFNGHILHFKKCWKFCSIRYATVHMIVSANVIQTLWTKANYDSIRVDRQSLSSVVIYKVRGVKMVLITLFVTITSLKYSLDGFESRHFITADVSKIVKILSVRILVFVVVVALLRRSHLRLRDDLQRRSTAFHFAQRVGSEALENASVPLGGVDNGQLIAYSNIQRNIFESDG